MEFPVVCLLLAALAAAGAVLALRPRCSAMPCSPGAVGAAAPPEAAPGAADTSADTSADTIADDPRVARVEAHLAQERRLALRFAADPDVARLFPCVGPQERARLRETEARLREDRAATAAFVSRPCVRSLFTSPGRPRRGRCARGTGERA